MQDVEDEPLFCERVAGLDIAKAEVEVTIRVPSDTTAGRRQQESRTFGTTRRELESLGDWLACWGVAKLGMEATGDYWKPVFFLLESRGFDCQLYNAGQVKALPGRPKTDRADSIWLARITERGSVCSSFVPPEPIRRLRTHTRYRRHLTQARTAESSGQGKLLEDGHLKLSSVIPGHRRRLRPGHARCTRRRAARPQSPGPAGPRLDARQDQPAGRRAGLLVLHRSARGRASDDAGGYRLLQRPDPGAHCHHRGADRTLAAPGRA